MAFGEKIRNLLHLERAFESNREIELPAKKQETVRIHIPARDFLDLIIQLQDRFNLFGQRLQRFDHARALRRREISHAPEEQSEKREDRELRRKRLRGRHTNLRPRMHVNAAVAFTRDRTRNVVANAKGAETFAPALAQCAERVCSFAALANGED